MDLPSRAAAPLQVPWRPPDSCHISKALGRESPSIQGLLSPACNRLRSPASPALRGRLVAELWPTDWPDSRTEPLRGAHALSPAPTPRGPGQGRNPPRAQNRSQKGPVLREAQAGSPPPPTAPWPVHGEVSPQADPHAGMRRRPDSPRLDSEPREAADGREAVWALPRLCAPTCSSPGPRRAGDQPRTPGNVPGPSPLP